MHMNPVSSLVPKNIVVSARFDPVYPYNPNKPLKYWRDTSISPTSPAFIQYSTYIGLSQTVNLRGPDIPLDSSGHPTDRLLFAVRASDAAAFNIPEPQKQVGNDDENLIPLRELLPTERVSQTAFSTQIQVADPGDSLIVPIAAGNENIVLAEIWDGIQRILKNLGA